ncbi:MAG: phytanoyl-CoA dioxygenase family protein [Proteobacteria bacterium]|nr:phytanoyl-CoA dioxygenase family protein [Pseudomonadota bacterium]
MADALQSSRTISAGDLCKASFWRALAPELNVGTIAAGAATQPQQSHDRLRRRMAREGYFTDVDPRLKTLAPTIGGAVKRLVQFGLPPVLVWTYDEPWECFRRLGPVIGNFLGSYKLLPAFWAWHVDPAKGESGWGPHRDRSVGALAADGSPLSLTCWIPLSDATPMNGCMYIVPACFDSNYNRPGSTQPMGMQASRALPAKPGDFLVWNQAVLHWGSLSSEFADEARMSMALEFQRGDIEPFQQPLLDNAALPPFAVRVRLIARQILQYTHMYRIPERHVQLGQFLSTAQLYED